MPGDSPCGLPGIACSGWWERLPSQERCHGAKRKLPRRLLHRWSEDCHTQAGIHLGYRRNERRRTRAKKVIQILKRESFRLFHISNLSASDCISTFFACFIHAFCNTPSHQASAIESLSQSPEANIVNGACGRSSETSPQNRSRV